MRKIIGEEQLKKFEVLKAGLRELKEQMTKNVVMLSERAV